MAIVQISQIKHRRGKRSDLPNSLEEGEIGLTLDTGEVFIGTPNFPPATLRSEENRFPYGNTQILTEWTDNVKNMLQYSYRFRSSEFDSLTGAYNYESDRASPIIKWIYDGQEKEMYVVRKLQERLDEVVSVKSYGARGDCSYDLTNIPENSKLIAETYALRRAVLDVVNVTNNPSQRDGWHPRALHFPAGVYAINDPLFLPPNSTWIGDGKGKTVITLVACSDKLNWKKRTVLFTVDGNLLPEDFDDQTTIDNHSYQNIDPTFSNPELLPNNIIVRGITFRVDVEQQGDNRYPFDICRLFRSSNVTFYDCEFIGNWSSTGEAKSNIEITPRGDFLYYGGDILYTGDSLAIMIDSGRAMQKSHKPSNINFINCDFSNTTYASLITDEVNNIGFYNSTFNRHYKGIVLSENQPISQDIEINITYSENGPGYIKVSNSYFSNIAREAIHSYKPSDITLFDEAIKNTNREYIGAGILSYFNRFENVGNGNTNNGSLDFLDINTSQNGFTPLTPIITFEDGSIHNISYSDTFSRSYIDEETDNVIGGTNIPRIKYNPIDQNLVITLQDFNQERFRKKTLTTKTNMFINPILTFSQVQATTIKINYILVYNDISNPLNFKRRSGTLIIVTNSEQMGVADYSEEYTDTGGNIDFSFDIQINNENLGLYYRNNETNPITLYYNYTYFNSLY